MTSPLEQCRDALKPCPFCGAKPGTLARPDNIDGSEFYAAVFCHCEGYSATAHAGRRGKTQDEATSAAHAAWNRRAAAEAALAAQPEPAGAKLYAAQSNSESAYDYCGRLQMRCCEWGVYWQAPDAHGVNLSHEQALELLRDVLGVEVEIAAAIPRYIDSTPHLSVGNSAFEHWFQAQPFATQAGIKQISRDSYAAGMGDPLVTYAAPVAAPVAQPPEPDMRHPKIQALIGSRARREIELSIAEALLDDPAHEISGTDGDYWLPMHDKIVALQSAAPVAQGWQPIETAPKDGTEVLLCAPGRLTYGAWAEPSPTPQLKYQDGFAPEEEWEEDFDPYWASWDGDFTETDPPTHWMPLPAAPKEPA